MLSKVVESSPDHPDSRIFDYNGRSKNGRYRKYSLRLRVPPDWEWRNANIFIIMCYPLSASRFLKNQKIHFLKTCSSPSPTMWELSPDPKILVLSGPWPELWPRTRKWPKNRPKMVILKVLYIVTGFTHIHQTWRDDRLGPNNDFWKYEEICFFAP